MATRVAMVTYEGRSMLDLTDGVMEGGRVGGSSTLVTRVLRIMFECGVTQPTLMTLTGPCSYSTCDPCS